MNALKLFALSLLAAIPSHANQPDPGLQALPARMHNTLEERSATSPICRVVAFMGHPSASGATQSLGSGTLVAVPGAGEQGESLVVTNWHVVTPDATEQPVTHVEVRFPGGFVSPARVECIDAEWDLAALTIATPPVAPVAIADQPPQLGELLTLAGYGNNGRLEQQTGQMLRYEAPSQQAPYELVAFRATARDGDSGGPVLNQRGQLVAVMFGTADGLTSATHCGRVRAFLGRCRGWRPAGPPAGTSSPQRLPSTFAPPAAGLPANGTTAHATHPQAPAGPPAVQPPAPSLPQPSPELQRLQQRHDKLLADRDALERRTADAEAILPQLDGARKQLEACGKERLALEGRLQQVTSELEALKRQVTITPPAGPPAGVAAPAAAGPPAEGPASALESVLSKGAAAALTGALVSFGLPAGLAGVAAGGAVWLVMRRGKKKLQTRLEALTPAMPVEAVERTRLEIARVPVTDHAFNRLVAALRREAQWNPPALPIISRVWSLYEQFASSASEKQPYREPLPPGATLGWTDPVHPRSE